MWAGDQLCAAFQSEGWSSASAWGSRGVGGRECGRVSVENGRVDCILCSRPVFELHIGGTLLRRDGSCQICRLRSRLFGGACGCRRRVKISSFCT